jgi:hypothetical protein
MNTVAATETAMNWNLSGALREVNTRYMQERVTAYHEAGHAVAAVVLGISLERVSIRRDYDADDGCETLGHCSRVERFAQPFWNSPAAFCAAPECEDYRARDWEERVIQSLLAGGIAQSMLTGEEYPSGCSHDHADVVRLARRYSSGAEREPQCPWQSPHIHPDADAGDDGANRVNNAADELDTDADVFAEVVAYVRWLRARTRRMLRRPEVWEAVQALAGVLLHRREREVGGAEAEQIARAVLQNPSLGEEYRRYGCTALEHYEAFLTDVQKLYRVSQGGGGGGRAVRDPSHP